MDWTRAPRPHQPGTEGASEPAAPLAPECPELHPRRLHCESESAGNGCQQGKPPRSSAALASRPSRQVNPRDSSTEPVYQLETAMGSGAKGAACPALPCLARCPRMLALSPVPR